MFAARLLSGAFRILAVIGFIFVAVSVTPVTKWWANSLAGEWSEPQGDILIVLGADEPSYGFIGTGSYWRAVYAVRAWRGGHFRTVVISGGKGIAYTMRDFLCFSGVPAEKVIVERESLSTHENAVFTARILRGVPGTRVLVTSDFHVYRSVRAFRKAGETVLPLPFPYANKRANVWTERVPLFLELGLETIKILRYRAAGWI